MRNSIFISYRRADAGYASSAIHDQLAAHFGRDRVFRDVEVLQPGADFAQTISQAVRQSAVCLVIIGPNWLSEENRVGARRIDDPNDFIRFEIETAFSQGIPVIPVLVGDAVLPLAVDLPENLRRLSHLNSVVIRSGREFAGNIERLIECIERFLLSPEPEGSVLLKDIGSEPQPQFAEPTE